MAAFMLQCLVDLIGTEWLIIIYWLSSSFTKVISVKLKARLVQYNNNKKENYYFNYFI